MKKRGVIAFCCLVVVLFLLGCSAEETELKYEDKEELERANSPKKTDATTEKTSLQQDPLMQNNVLVQIRDNFAFEPQMITISAGTDASWKTQGNIKEPIRISSSLFESYQLKSNDIFSYTFNKKGAYTVEVLNKGKTMEVEVV